ncbi:MAG TPA: NmrA/HSCARG family protein [Acidimicrobiia bacterium]|nr:NmrA/HSCARG family protein [Acidimicrobiia bacterium]
MDRLIAVCGATGRQGGAVTRALLQGGWDVRAITRRTDSAQAKELATLGAEITKADMEDVESLRRAFHDVSGVFSVQNGLVSGFDREVIQGRNVADAASHCGVDHLVYAAAGTGERGTGIPSWEAKLDVEDHMSRLGLPFTSLRPEAFMELMTDKKFYPSVGTWRIWPRLSGEDKGIAWLAVEDVGVVAASVFAEPDKYVGESLVLVADVKSLAECRDIYREVMGKDPSTFPMPVWLFDRFTRGDVTAIWRWVEREEFSTDTTLTRSIHPQALDVREWMVRQRAGAETTKQRGR